MYIFIDESGLFIPSNKATQWSTVGALVIPDTSIDNVNSALLKLKNDNELEDDQEFKRNRPDSENASFIEFLENIRKYNCTLYAVSQTGSIDEAEGVSEHKKHTMAGVENYLCLKNKSGEEYTEIIEMIKNMNITAI